MDDKTLKAAKKAWERARDLPHAMAYSAEILQAFKAGRITKEEATAAAEAAMVQNGMSESLLAHIKSLTSAAPHADPQTIINVAKMLDGRGTKAGDADAARLVNEEMAAQLPDGLPQLVTRLHRMLSDSKVPPEAGAQLCQTLFEQGIRAEDIEGVDIHETSDLGVAHIRLRAKRDPSDSIGPTVGTA